MAHPEMAAQGVTAKPTFETNDIVAPHRLPDRHCRLERQRRCTRLEPAKRSMHLDDQCHELVGSDLVMPHVAPDDACDMMQIDPAR